MYSPSANHSWCTPREFGPERSKNAMRFGFSGVEMSNSSTAGLRVAGLLRLIGDRQDVADRLQRVGAHAVVRQVGARDDLQRLRVGDIDRGVVLRRAFMRHPQDAPPVLGQLHRHALAHAAEPVERMVRKLAKIPDQRVAVAGRALHCPSPLSLRVACVNPRKRFRSYPRSYSGRVPVISATARTAARATRQTACGRFNCCRRGLGLRFLARRCRRPATRQTASPALPARTVTYCCVAGQVGNPDQPDRADMPVRLEREDPPREVDPGISLPARRHVDAIPHGPT